jgi:hypothetical protein
MITYICQNICQKLIFFSFFVFLIVICGVFDLVILWLLRSLYGVTNGMVDRTIGLTRASNSRHDASVNRKNHMIHKVFSLIFLFLNRYLHKIDNYPLFFLRQSFCGFFAKFACEQHDKFYNIFRCLCVQTHSCRREIQSFEFVPRIQVECQ